MDAKFKEALRLHQAGLTVKAQAIYRDILRDEPLNFNACHLFGVSLLETGDVRQGVFVIQKAVGIKHDSAEACYNLAHGLRLLGELDNALLWLQKTIMLNCGDPEYFFEAANVLRDLKRFEEALACYAKAIELRPNYFQAYNNRGSVFKQRSQIDEALADYGKAIALKNDYAEAYGNRGNALKEIGRYEEAIADYDKAISLRYRYAEAYCNRANALKEVGRVEDAFADYDKAIKLKADYAEAFNNRGNLLSRLGRAEEAIEDYDKAIRINADYAEAYNNRGSALVELRRFDDAIASFGQSISKDAGYAEAYYNKGVALSEIGQLEEALSCYDRAISLKNGYADALSNKAHLLLRRGDYAEGFELYRARWQRSDFKSRGPATRIPMWNGSAVGGSLLLWAEQGIGDEVFYSSLLSLIPHQRLNVTLIADKRLHAVFQRSFPEIRILDRGLQEDTIDSGYSFQAPIGDLGGILKLDKEKIAKRRYPFLAASESRKQNLMSSGEIFGAGTVCGISWRTSNPRASWNRSIPLSQLMPLLRIPGIQFVNLQYGDVSQEISDMRSEHGISISSIPELDVFNDLDGLLALMDACDLVVTIDNITAHLAGAIGKRSIVLVPQGAGRIWYWHDDDVSRWYPSVKLIHQDCVGQWDSAITSAAEWVRCAL